MEELLLKSVDVPFWGSAAAWQLVSVAVGALVAVAALFLFLPLGAALFALLNIAVVAAILAGGLYGLYHLDDANRIAERRSLDERASALFTQTVQPGSFLACIDGSPQQAMFEACERTLFAGPERLAAAVAIVNQRLAFLADALEFAERRDATYLTRIEPMRRAIEADPYGLVAHALASEHRCTVDNCAELALIRDPARVRENLRGRRFEAHMMKYAARWHAGGDAAASAGAAAANREGGPATVPGMSVGEQAVPGVSIDERPAAGRLNHLPKAEFVTPAAATPPALTPAPPEFQSTAKAPAVPSPRPAAGAGKDKATSAARPKATNPASRRSPEPVAGLPRVVPADYLRQLEEEEEERAAAAAAAAEVQSAKSSGQAPTEAPAFSAQPAAPSPFAQPMDR
jgi:hypothetical protein